jgi:sortase A
MQDRPERQSASRRGRALLWLERLLLMAGAGMLVWCAALIVEAIIAQRSARRVLEPSVATTPAVEPAVIAPALEDDADDAETVPDIPSLQTGSPIAALSIPRVQLSAAVLHGSDARTLRHGPGHLENTAYPGDTGNVVIAGHRDSFFWPLRNIRLGDDIFLDTPEGRFHYQVTSLRVVNPRDISVLAQGEAPVLTLITCYPFQVLGRAPDRFIVRADRVRDGAALIAARSLPSSALLTAPVLDVPRAVDSSELVEKELDPQPERPVDEEVLVQQVVRRYETTYRPGVTMVCDVAIDEDHATATCDASAHGNYSYGRTFDLERGSAGWAIKLIVTR